jgi:hypothetical protein
MAISYKKRYKARNNPAQANVQAKMVGKAKDQRIGFGLA